MACRLILNADDFGLTRGVNRAIAELHQAGAISSTTLMATGAAFDDAIRLAASLPTLGVGCHVTLVDGAPAAPLDEVPSLLGSDRKTFRPTLGGFVRDLVAGRIREDEVVHEAVAQIRRLQGAGVRVTHVDTHKHTHMFPPIARAVLQAARRCSISAMRNPFEPRWSTALRLQKTSTMRSAQLAVLHRLHPAFRRLFSPDGPVRTTHGTLGVAVTGNLDASALKKLLIAAQTYGEDDTIYELVCHPGYNDADLAQANTRLRQQREEERVAFLKIASEWPGMTKPPKLIHYGDLPG